MKSASQDYIAQEESFYRRPFELYKIWRGSDVWRYTSGDIAVDYEGYTWQPATIERGTVQYNSDLECSELEVTFAKVDPAVTAYFAGFPMKKTWIEVRKLFHGLNPLEHVVLFVGEIHSVALKGPAAQAKCVGAESVLRRSVPRYTYQPECNWTLFGAQCGLDDTAYKLSVAADVQVDENTNTQWLVATEFGGQLDGYWVLGCVEYENDKYPIAEHAGHSIRLSRPIAGLTEGENININVYPGCDGKLATCRDKFNNLLNFGGHPYIPLDNPCMWVRK